MADSRAAGALAAAAALGPFSAVSAAPAPDWVPWSALVEEPGVLRRRVEQVRAVLAAGPGSPDVPLRVAASLVQLGLVARLLAPLLGAVLLTGLLPVTAPEQVRLRLRGANPLPLAFGGATVVPADVDPAGTLARHWLLPAVEPLSAGVHRDFRLSRRVLDGNVASAVAGALRTATAVRPELTVRADGLLDALLADGPLTGAGSRRDDGTFVRRSCCLFYRLPGAGTCGDCLLG